MTTDALARFNNEKYLSLETFRKNGTGVKTPLWFVEEAGVLYMRTPMDSWKVKRIRRSSEVRLVPSDVRGTPDGEWLMGEAEVFPAAEMAWVDEQVKKKYGLLKRLMDLRGLVKKMEIAVIAVRLT